MQLRAQVAFRRTYRLDNIRNYHYACFTRLNSVTARRVTVGRIEDDRIGTALPFHAVAIAQRTAGMLVEIIIITCAQFTRCLRCR